MGGLTNVPKGNQEWEGEDLIVIARGNYVMSQKPTFVGGGKAVSETSPIRSVLGPRLSEYVLAGGRKLRLMLFQTLGETATAGCNILTKLLHVALTGVAHLLQSLLHGLNPRLTWR
jgi:hypothetical protein